MQLNYNILAKTCEVSTETVTGILAAMREQVADCVIVQKHNLTLSFHFGQLAFKNGEVEFKVSEAQPIAVTDQIPYSKEFDAATNAKQ